MRVHFFLFGSCSAQIARMQTLLRFLVQKTRVQPEMHKIHARKRFFVHRALIQLQNALDRELEISGAPRESLVSVWGRVLALYGPVVARLTIG